MQQQFWAKTLPLCVGVFILSIIIGYGVLAWTEPSVTPPGGNIAAPINTGLTTQNKSGGLNIIGNVGIGTTSPGDKLDVAGNIILGGTGEKFILHPRTGTGDFLQITNQNGGGSWLWGQGITLRDNGNVGIGTTSPGAMLDVGNGASQCCASQVPNISVAQASNTNGNMAWINFHNAGEAEAYIRLAGGGTGIRAGQRRLEIGDSQGANTGLTVQGNVGIGTTSPVQKLDVNGYVNGRSGLCINNQCCKSWAECLSLGSGFNPSTYPCSGTALPSSGSIKNKRMFVTSSSYNASTFVTQMYNSSQKTPTVSSETLADQKCQQAAISAGLNNGTFKALVYMGKRDINSVVPGGSVFWTCDRTNGWKQIAQGFNDFFQKDSNGNYIDNQIYDEFGNSSNATVWTGFEINSSNGYTLLSKDNNGCNPPISSFGWWGGCFNSTYWYDTCKGYTCKTSAVAWYGIPNTTTANWAHSGTFSKCNVCCYVPNQTWEACAAISRALYCIEQ